jgi:hypothetical protein
MTQCNISLPHKEVYLKARRKDRNSLQLKEYLVLLGMRGLAHGDMTRVNLIAGLLVGRRLSHA